MLPNKTKKIYTQAFNEIRRLVPEFEPKHVITDFETGAINAFKSVYPIAKIHGCFFHLGQSLWRKIQNIGLAQRYSSDAEFALHVRELLALAFVPAADIPNAFSILCSSDFWKVDEEDEYSPMLQELLAYFESTYIGIETRTQATRGQAMFPPELWSVHEITILGKYL